MGIVVCVIPAPQGSMLQVVAWMYASHAPQEQWHLPINQQLVLHVDKEHSALASLQTVLYVQQAILPPKTISRHVRHAVLDPALTSKLAHLSAPLAMQDIILRSMDRLVAQLVQAVHSALVLHRSVQNVHQEPFRVPMPANAPIAPTRRSQHHMDRLGVRFATTGMKHPAQGIASLVRQEQKNQFWMVAVPPAKLAQLARQVQRYIARHVLVVSSQQVLGPSNVPHADQEISRITKQLGRLLVLHAPQERRVMGQLITVRAFTDIIFFSLN